jgi:hypothetical protein
MDVDVIERAGGRVSRGRDDCHHRRVEAAQTIELALECANVHAIGDRRNDHHASHPETQLSNGARDRVVRVLAAEHRWLRVADAIRPCVGATRPRAPPAARKMSLRFRPT